MSLGSKIKSLREKQRLTQSELAKRSGITQATLSRAEHHLINQLKSDALRRLALELHTTVDYLVGKDDATDVDSILRSDPEIKGFIELYSELNTDSRDSVKDFMRYLGASTANPDGQ